jgi:hypothetical protein
MATSQESGGPNGATFRSHRVLPYRPHSVFGRRLLGLVVEHPQDHGHKRVFLGCSADPSTRLYGFYRYLGWASTGTFDRAGDEVLELHPPERKR